MFLEVKNLQAKVTRKLACAAAQREGGGEGGILCNIDTIILLESAVSDREILTNQKNGKY